MLNFKKIVLVGSMGVAVAATALTGCQTRPNDGRTEGRMIDDKKITENVKERLQSEPVYKFRTVDVKTYNGVVQLSGFADTEEQKRRAEELASNVQGVRQVVNAIALKPETPTPTGRTNQGQPGNPNQPNNPNQ